MSARRGRARLGLSAIVLGAAALGACGADEPAPDACAGAQCGGKGGASSTQPVGGAGGGGDVDDPWQDVDEPEPTCGDGVCSAEDGETCVVCPSECGPCAPGCGDMICDPGETCASCPADCGGCPPGCGDGVCGLDESCLDCSLDCGACAPGCGDGICEGGETCALCSLDCGECPTACGDGACNGGETCVSCKADCGECAPGCGDGACDGEETCAGCPADCGACAPSCGDGACDGGETCLSCEADCGACGNALKSQLTKCAAPVAKSPQGKRDVTFVALGDPHVVDGSPGCPTDWPARVDHSALREAIKSAASHAWPSGKGFSNEGKKYTGLRGAIVVGDLTHTGDASVPAGQATCLQFDRFLSELGRCGDEDQLPIPVYALYGNHDFPYSSPADVDFHPVIDRLDKITHKHRPGKKVDLFDDTRGGTGHYAWRWDDIWFVNLDVKPGYKVETITKDGVAGGPKRKVDPHHSTQFLRSFLEHQPEDSKRQIVILAHYGVGSQRVHDDERAAFCRVIDEAQQGTGSFNGKKKLSETWPVLAYLHGHTHSPPEMHKDPFRCKAPHASIAIPQFSTGTPQWKAPPPAGEPTPANPHKDRFIDFTMFHIGPGALEVVGLSVDALDPTGGWRTVYAERLEIARAP